MAKSPRQLLDLPDEILNFVAEAVDHVTSLRALARTCTRFQDHAERFIYRLLTIEHGAQARGLHKAICRRPRRATMALKFTVAPNAVATRGTEHIPLMLEKMNCLKDVFIESPFCNRPACSEFVEDQEQYAKIFCKSSLQVIDTSDRLLSQLLSCTLNFTGYHSRMYPIDTELSSIFLHPTLQSLNISCARIDGVELHHLKAFAQRTPLSSLSLDQCDMSTSGLTSILSLPASLKALKVLEVSRQGPQRHTLDYSWALLRALSLQRKSLESLCLSLRGPKLSPFSQDFDMSSFGVLRLLRISCQRRSESVYPTSLRWATYAPPTLDTLVFSGIEIQDRRRNVVFPSELQACLKTLDPADLRYLARTVCLSLQYGSDVRVDGRKALEELGNRFRKASSQTSRASPSGGTSHNDEGRDSPRLCVSRFTRGRGAIPPFLYHEHEPEELPLYDSSAKGSGWLNATDRSSGAPDFPHIDEQFNLDFTELEAGDVLHNFDFDSFLNNEPDGDMHTLVNVDQDLLPQYHHTGDTAPPWPAQTGPLDLDPPLATPLTPVHAPPYGDGVSNGSG